MTEEVKRDPVLQRIDRFYGHLDVCSQCRNHPFDLCPTGAWLLKEAATGEFEKSVKALQSGRS